MRWLPNRQPPIIFSLLFSFIFALPFAQRPPADFKGNARAEQKSLPGNAEIDCFEEKYVTRCGNFRNEVRLAQK
jgi:hypothetical protein